MEDNKSISETESQGAPLLQESNGEEEKRIMPEENIEGNKEQGDTSTFRKIDKLLNKKDIGYRGIFSSSAFRILGFTFLFFAQVFIAINLITKIVDLPGPVTDISTVLDVLSLFALPLFLASNFCTIMTSQQKIKRMMLNYSALALGIYVAIIFVFYRYIMGVGNFLYRDNPAEAYNFADQIVKGVFGKLVNYNIFVDLSLFCFFYFFFFYTPKNIKSRGMMIFFRSLSILPILCAIAATILYGLYYQSIIVLPVAILAILPCRSIMIYSIFFILAVLIKLRKIVFISKGGTEEEYAEYIKTKRSSFRVSLLASSVLIVLCGIDQLLLYLDPTSLFYGIGFNFYLLFFVPFILLFSYTRKPKKFIWNVTMVIIFVIAVIILYLETGLYIINNIV